MKIVCIGSSLTKGYGLNSPCDNWTWLLAQHTGFTFINSGVNGDTSLQVLSRFSNDALNYKPDYIHIMCGTNDFIYTDSTASDVLENISFMVEDCRSSEIIPIIGISPCLDSSMAKIEWSSLTDYNHVNQCLLELRTLIMKYCEKEEISYIDYLTAFQYETKGKNMKDYSLDGLHPTPKGQEILYKAAYNLISKL